MINTEILKSIKDRDKAFQEFKKFKTEEEYSVFKELRNKTQNMFYNAKRDYFKINLKVIRTQSHYGALSRIWVCRPKKEKALQVLLVLKLIGVQKFKFRTTVYVVKTEIVMAVEYVCIYVRSDLDRFNQFIKISLFRGPVDNSTNNSFRFR